jgi:hypothetical protein
MGHLPNLMKLAEFCAWVQGGELATNLRYCEASEPSWRIVLSYHNPSSLLHEGSETSKCLQLPKPLAVGKKCRYNSNAAQHCPSPGKSPLWSLCQHPAVKLATGDDCRLTTSFISSEGPCLTLWCSGYGSKRHALPPGHHFGHCGALPLGMAPQGGVVVEPFERAHSNLFEK